MALGLLLSSLPVAALAATPGLTVTIALFAIMGFALAPSATLTMTVFQQRTPPELRGRVFGARLAIQTASIPIGALIAGVLLELFGLAPTIVAIAIPYLLTCAAPLVIPAIASSIRRLDRQQFRRQPDLSSPDKPAVWRVAV